ELCDCAKSISAGDTHRDAKALEFPSIDGKMRLGAGNDEKVTGIHAPTPTIFHFLFGASNRGAALDPSVDRFGDLLGFVRYDRVLGSKLFGNLQDPHAGEVPGTPLVACHKHGTASRGIVSFRFGKGLIKDLIDPFDHGPNGPEIRIQFHDGSILLNDFLDALVGHYVSSPKTIDGLLRVADDEERAGRRPAFRPIWFHR